MEILELGPSHREAVDAYVRHLWSGPMLVSLGSAYDSHLLPGFVAIGEGALLGFALYRMEGDACEVSALLSLIQGEGVGTKLLDRVKQEAAEKGCTRLWLVTTNDNTSAIRFYQSYGFSIKVIHTNAMDRVRQMKKGLPMIGENGIPLAHELEFDLEHFSKT